MTIAHPCLYSGLTPNGIVVAFIPVVRRTAFCIFNAQISSESSQDSGKGKGFALDAWTCIPIILIRGDQRTTTMQLSDCTHDTLVGLKALVKDPGVDILLPITIFLLQAASSGYQACLGEPKSFPESVSSVNSLAVQEYSRMTHATDATLLTYTRLKTLA